MKRLILIFWISLNSAYSFGEERNLRIISLAPAITEILFELGLEEQIVGVTTICNYPERVKFKEKVGTFSQPNIEKIISLRPDIIFATGLEQVESVDRLKKLGFFVYVSHPKNFKELFCSILDIGRLTYREEAEILVRKMESKIKRIKEKVSSLPKESPPKIFFEIWSNPLMTAGEDSFIDELIRLAGGINIAHDAGRPYCQFNPEIVIKRNPDFIILAYMGERKNLEIKKRLGWSQIKAVKNNQIISDIHPDLLLKPGPRLVDGLEEIFKRIYQ